jgi:hypothetical protein
MEKYIWYSKTRGAKGSYIVRPWHSDISYFSLGFSLTSPINRSITSVLISLTALSLVISFYYYTPLPWYPSKHSILSNVIPRTLYSEYHTSNIILRTSSCFELPLASNFLLLPSSCFHHPSLNIILRYVLRSLSSFCCFLYHSIFNITSRFMVHFRIIALENPPVIVPLTNNIHRYKHQSWVLRSVSALSPSWVPW